MMRAVTMKNMPTLPSDRYLQIAMWGVFMAASAAIGLFMTARLTDSTLLRGVGLALYPVSFFASKKARVLVSRRRMLRRRRLRHAVEENGRTLGATSESYEDPTPNRHLWPGGVIVFATYLSLSVAFGALLSRWADSGTSASLAAGFAWIGFVLALLALKMVRSGVIDL
jgi:hypothetical protein